MRRKHFAALPLVAALQWAAALGAQPSQPAQPPQPLQAAAQSGQSAQSADAVDSYGQLENPALQARYERITLQLRCLVCQNESIADSNVELAADLRRQVREMLIAGQSDESIFSFMTDRYGEFVRFSPPLEPKTLIIWGAPFVMLALGGAIIYRVARQRSRLPLDDASSTGPM